MIINCNEESMVLMVDNYQIEITIEGVKEIMKKYEDYFDYRDEPDFCMKDPNKDKENKINEEILKIVKQYVNKHSLGKTIGTEYVSQDDEAILDGETMFGDIMEVYAKYNEEEE